MGAIYRLENALKQTISIINAGWGSFSEFHPFITDSLRNIVCLSDSQQAMLIKQRLLILDGMMSHFESLVSLDVNNKVGRLVALARHGGACESEAELRKKYEEQVRGTQAKELAKIKADFASFRLVGVWS